MSRDVVGSFGVVGTFGEPSLDSLAVCRSVVVVAAFETKPKNTASVFIPIHFRAFFKINKVTWTCRRHRRSFSPLSPSP